MYGTSECIRYISTAVNPKLHKNFKSFRFCGVGAVLHY